MILNPKGTAMAAKKRRRRTMSALQAKYFGKRRRARGSSSRKRRRSGGGRVVIVSSNPRSHSVKRRRMRRNPRVARVARRRFRRNPISATGFLSNTLMPAAVGAGGAVAVDMLSGYLTPYLPVSLQSPTMKPITNIGLSLLVGWGVSALGGNKMGGEAAAGGIIVALYNFLGAELQSGFGLPGAAPYAYNNQTMQRYMNGMGFIRRRNLGVINAKRQAMGLAPIGVNTLDATRPNLNGGPYAQTKFRMMRNGGAGGRTMGYIGPARTMGRYMNNGR